jgi:hypothetical protein
MTETTSTAATNRKTATTKRSTAAKKAAQTRSANRAAEARKRTASAAKAAETRAENAKKPVEKVQEKVTDYAERAVSVQVGAALLARDAVVEAVDGLRGAIPTSPKQAEQELKLRRQRAIAGLEAEFKRFERRGTSARKQVRSDVKSLRSDLSKQVTNVAAPSKYVSARVENLVQTGLTAGQKAATTVQERIASIA